MPLPELGPGEDWQKQLRKVVVSAGPLKGARYPEVSWEDLRRAAKSYKQDPRFCQYAKRMMSEKALGSRPAQPQTASRTWRKMGAEWLMWGLAKAKGKAVLFTFFSTFGMHVDFEATLLCGHGQEFDHGHPISASSQFWTCDYSN